MIVPTIMRSTSALTIISLLSSTVHAQSANLRARSLDAILVEPQEPEPQSPAHPFLRHLDLRSAMPSIPYLKELNLRQVAPAANAAAGTNAQANANANAGTGTNAGAQAGAQQPAAQGNAGVNQAANNANADPNAQQAAGGQAAGGAPVAPAPAQNAAAGAPVAGVGGGGAPAAAQPGANAGQANPVTVITVATVVGGVTKQVPQTFTQSEGLGGSAPPVKTGTIGMGSLTGKIGVVKTDSAKSDAVPLRDHTSKRWAVLGIMGSWVAAMLLGGAIIGAR